MKKKLVKIVKRDERGRSSRTPRVKNSQPEDPTRKAIQTVSGWVREFKEKGNTGVLATLFEKPIRPSEA